MNKEADKNGDASDRGDVTVTVLLRAALHCEGCAHKLKRSIKHLDCVESVNTNYKTGKVTVIGKLDPIKVKERVEKKTKKAAHLVSPRLAHKKINDNGGSCSGIKSDEKKPVDDSNNEEQIEPEEDAVKTIVLKTRVHGERCAHKMSKIIGKYEGVEDVNVDIEKDEITITGTMDVKTMVSHLNTKFKRVVELAMPPKIDVGTDINLKDDGGGDGGDKEDLKLVVGSDDETKEVVKPETTSSDSGQESGKVVEEINKEDEVEVMNKMELNGANPYEYGAHMYNPQQEQREYMHAPAYYSNTSPPPFYTHAPQLFSDENPNACSVM